MPAPFKNATRNSRSARPATVAFLPHRGTRPGTSSVPAGRCRPGSDEVFLCGVEVLVYVAAEVCWVIGVRRYAQPEIQHLLQVVVLDGVEDAQLDVGERAHGKGYMLFSEPLHELRVLHVTNAVV